MRDKEKQIEEMAKIIDDRLIEANNVLGSMNKGEGYWIAQKLVEHYQPKLPEDSVVLSKEEWREYVDNENEAYYRGQHEAEVYYKNIQIPRERKETAEKFVNLPKSKILTVIHDYEEIKVVELKELQELAKQFGVETKE